MKAAEIQHFGAPHVLRVVERDQPPIGPNSVLVRVDAAGVNPGDARIRRGEFAMMARHIFPAVLGWEASGTVEQVGISVSEFVPGDRVFGVFRQDYVGDGAYAEFVAVDDRQVVHRPSNLPTIEAAGLGATGSTAFGLVHSLAAVTDEDTVVVSGASGGVGHLSVQLAAMTGAHVIGLTRAQNHDFVLGLGAHEVYDYTDDALLTKFRQHHAEGVTVFVDTVGGTMQELAVELLATSGRMASCVHPPASEAFARRGVTARFQFLQPNRDILASLARLASEKNLKVHISQTHCLDDVTRAHEQIESGHTRGKIVLTMPHESTA